MRSPAATVVVMVGRVPDALLRELGGMPNVQALRLTEEGAPPVREVLGGAHRPFLVHDLDPLAAVARAWIGFFDDPASIGVLHIEVESALAAFSSGAAVLPDYYLVADPETLTATEAQWWLGVLAAVAPARVIPVPANGGAVRRALATLPTGRGWPDPAGWLRGLDLQVPDRAGLL